MQQSQSSTARQSLSGSPSERERFLNLYERESAITRKVLGAYPGAQSDLKPHDRSNSAKALASTFVIEQALILKALRREMVLGAGWPATAESWEGLLAQFDEGREQILEMLRNSDDNLLDGTVTFFVGPKQTGDYALSEFVTFMAHDQIHHRGQMSVYLRMAGAKVPSIYGPSADEPWN
jgi:uncharacterized damage-inducible protein DinB